MVWTASIVCVCSPNTEEIKCDCPHIELPTQKAPPPFEPAPDVDPSLRIGSTAQTDPTPPKVNRAVADLLGDLTTSAADLIADVSGSEQDKSIAKAIRGAELREKAKRKREEENLQKL